VLRSAIAKYVLRAVFVLLACCLSHAQAPTITLISPNPGGIGQSVNISGSNFGSSGTVTFSGVTATTTVWSTTAITATVPVGTVTGNVVVTSGGNASSGFPFTLNNGPVNYIYDNLGRLAAVIDVNGNAAEYSYDIVGNILSIARFTSTQVSIIDFTPQTGPVGTAVTINGTGFSATPSQNTVKFNGTAATVSSATNTQIQVTVPTSATNGPISVTSPNGSATSTTNFTVTSSNGVPTITSFSPTSGVTGTSVGLVGTNFNLTPSNDELRMNASPATPTANTVTLTTIGTTVPAATASGHFSLFTPAGSAVSSQDFYVPFLTHVAGDIGLATRISIGGSQPVTLAANKIAMVLFDAVAGQRVSIGMAGSTFPNPCYLYLIAPNNTASPLISCSAGSTPYVPSTLLNSTGTYTIGIDPGSNSGSLTLSLTQDFLGSIVIDGPAVTATTTTPSQDARLTFESTGQRVVVYATNVSNQGANLNLVTPQGTTQAAIAINNNNAGQTFFMDTQTLSLGTYQLWVPHNGISGGSETLQISSVPQDFTAPLPLPAAGAVGTAVRVPTTGNLAVGQNASLTFTVAANQKASFNVINPTIGTGYSACLLTVFGPSPSTTPVTSGYCGTGAASYIDTVTLATAGIYTVYIDPQGTAVGSVSISLNNDQDVTTPAISINAAAATWSTTTAGQDARLSFTPTLQQTRIVMLATNVTNPNASLNLWNGTSTQASVPINNNPSGQTFFMDTQPVTSGQQYQVWVQHSGTNIGSETLQVDSVPADFTGTLTLPAVGATGTAVRVPTTGNLVIGQNASLTFTVGANQPVSFNVINPTIGSASTSCILTVIGPSPSTTQITSGYCGTGSSNYIGPVTLATAGTYTVYMDPQGMAVGTVSISLNNDANFTGTLTVPAAGAAGTAVRVPTSGSLGIGQSGSLTFSATASQRLSFNVTGSTIGSSYVSCSLMVSGPSPSTTQITYGWCGEPNGVSEFVDTVTIPTTGTYTVSIVPQGTATGSVSVSINNDQDVTTPTISIGGAAVTGTTTVAGQDVRLSFTPTSSQPRIAVLVNNVTNPSASLNLWNVNTNATQASIPINNSPAGQTFFLDTQPVTSGQPYQLWVKHSGTNFGKENLQIKNVPADLGLLATVGGKAVNFSTVAGQNATIQFTSNTSESLHVNWTGGTYPSALNCYITVTGPSPSTTQVGFGYCNTPTGQVALNSGNSLPAGQYNILVDPQAQSAGQMSLTVTTP
jgi:YD repeat-containing protein